MNLAPKVKREKPLVIGWLNGMLAEAVKEDQSVYVYKVWFSKPTTEGRHSRYQALGSE
jgi:hypothetical protein